MGKVLVILLIIVACWIGFMHLGQDKIVEDSVYQGHVIDFGKKGLFWQTHEGSFALGGVNRSSTGWFSLDEEARNGEDTAELARLLTEAVETGKKVKVWGKRSLTCWPWRSGANYHVSKVEFIEDFE